MAAEIVFTTEAEKDVDEAYSWYEKQRAGLGEEFMTAVDACIQALARWPAMHQTVHESFRRALLRRFPYAVFYEFIDDDVTIYAVFHTSRDPDKWRERLA